MGKEKEAGKNIDTRSLLNVDQKLSPPALSYGGVDSCIAMPAY